MDQYTYDAWNRLVKVQKAYRVATDDGAGGVTLGAVQLGSVVSEMRYDGLGRRIEKKIENSADLDFTYEYYYDGLHVVQMCDGSDDITERYAWGNAAGGAGGYVDDLVWIGSSEFGGGIDTYHWVLQGPNYDVRGVIDSTGGLLERYTYTPYGQRRVYTSAGSNDGGLHARALMSQRVTVFDIPQPYALNPFGHQGLMHDETLGLIYNRAREVDPDLGFIQPDPLGYVDGMNLHQYEGSDPVGHTDWKGKCEFTERTARKALLDDINAWRGKGWNFAANLLVHFLKKKGGTYKATVADRNEIQKHSSKKIIDELSNYNQLANGKPIHLSKHLNWESYFADRDMTYAYGGADVDVSGIAHIAAWHSMELIGSGLSFKYPEWHVKAVVTITDYYSFKPYNWLRRQFKDYRAGHFLQKCLGYKPFHDKAVLKTTYIWGR